MAVAPISGCNRHFAYLWKTFSKIKYNNHNLRLNTSVHAKQRAMDGLQIVQNFFMDLCQFAVQPNHPTVGLPFVAFPAVWAVSAVFADVQLFCPPVLVSTDMDISLSVFVPKLRVLQIEHFLLLFNLTL